MKYLRYTIVVVLICALGISVRCSVDPLAGGSEVGNPTSAIIIGKAVYSNSGTVASRAKVRLRTDKFTAVNSSVPVNGRSSRYYNTLTDDSGYFLIRGIDSGRYCIEINDDSSAHNGTSSAAIVFCTVSAGDSLIPIFTAVSLKKAGSLTGSYRSLPNKSIRIGLQGIDRSAILNATSKTFSIPDLPEGNFRFYVVSGSGVYLPNGENTVRVESNKVSTTDAIDLAPMSDWLVSQRLTLNTTASGADISKDVFGFPLLVTLSADKFDFNRAGTDGGDIRFTKNNGTPLSYAIERWDAVNKRADIWVKLDTVYGDNSTQSLMMYWGNSDAVDNSNDAAVFDTASGFQGVWHLSENGNAIVKDATGNHYDGTPSDTAPANTDGVIGSCKAFNGSSNFIHMKGTADSKLNFQQNGIYSISAWVYVDTLDNGFHLIAGKGNEQYYLKLKRSVPITTMRWEFVEYQDKTGWAITNAVPSANAWAYLVGIRNGATQYLYLNGELVDSSISISTSNMSRTTECDIMIGEYLTLPADTAEGKCQFSGKIDEVRISNVAYSQDWIKLCYKNQKEQNVLIKW